MPHGEPAINRDFPYCCSLSVYDGTQHIDRETEARRRQVTCPRAHHSGESEPKVQPAWPASEPALLTLTLCCVHLALWLFTQQGLKCCPNCLLKYPNCSKFGPFSHTVPLAWKILLSNKHRTNPPQFLISSKCPKMFFSSSECLWPFHCP